MYTYNVLILRREPDSSSLVVTVQNENCRSHFYCCHCASFTFHSSFCITPRPAARLRRKRIQTNSHRVVKGSSRSAKHDVRVFCHAILSPMLDEAGLMPVPVVAKGTTILSELERGSIARPDIRPLRCRLHSIFFSQDTNHANIHVSATCRTFSPVEFSGLVSAVAFSVSAGTGRRPVYVALRAARRSVSGNAQVP